MDQISLPASCSCFKQRERERERERGWMSWKENIEADESSLTSLFDP